MSNQIPHIPENKELYCTSLPTRPDPQLKTILVTGASGYIGGRLVPELLARGYSVRIMARQPMPETVPIWPGAEVVVADALNKESLDRVLAGTDAAYYLIHSLLLGPKDFENAEIQAAVNFRDAASRCGLKRIIYLGGLGDNKASLSPHLRSRIRVAQELQKGSVPVTVLRAAIIIGSGSASYEIINHLVRKLPVLPVPVWARTLCQPIAVRDVIKYLVGVLESERTSGGSYDIGGDDILSYESMLRTQADLLKRKRVFVPVPVSEIRVFSYIASLFTPVPHQITHCLFESSSNEVVCKENNIRIFLPFVTVPLRQALVLALSREEQDHVRTRWSDAYPPAHELAIKLREAKPAPQYGTAYSVTSAKSATELFASVCRIGGREGWFNTNWMWKLRGLVDRILLGVGTQRGRRNRQYLRVNDVIDFWRVEELEPDRKLLLRAEMKLPGRAWLQFTVSPCTSGNSISVRAFYQTEGFPGKMYWYVFLPFHHFIFKDLITQIEKKS